jgi:hypothetical protein
MRFHWYFCNTAKTSASVVGFVSCKSNAFSKEMFQLVSLYTILDAKMSVFLSNILMSLGSANVLWLNQSHISESKISEVNAKTSVLSLGSGRTWLDNSSTYPAVFPLFLSLWCLYKNPGHTNVHSSQTNVYLYVWWRMEQRTLEVWIDVGWKEAGQKTNKGFIFNGTSYESSVSVIYTPEGRGFDFRWY